MRTGVACAWVAVAAWGAAGCTSSGSVTGAVDAAVVDATSVAPMPDAGPPVVVDSAPPAQPDAGVDAGSAIDAGDDAACAWSGTVESPACSSCLRAVCCGVTSTCFGDPGCAALDSCVNGCLESGGGDAGESGCEEGCADEQTQATRDEYQAWTSCLGTSCGGNSGAGPCL